MMGFKNLTVAFLLLGESILSLRPLAEEPNKVRTLEEDYQLISSVADSIAKLKSLIALDSISPYWSGKVARQLDIFQASREDLNEYMLVTGKALGTDKSNDAKAANLTTMLRLHKDAYGIRAETWTGFGTPFANARDTLMEFVNHPELRPRFIKALGSDSMLNRLISPLTEIHLMQLEAGIARNEEKIRRYKIKYGPASARLNLLEVGLNWALQKAPLFRSTESGPGHLEFIASYSTAYLVLYNSGMGNFTSRPTLTSAFECGFRYYVYRQGWGGEGIVDRMFRPAYITFGGLLANGTDGFLRLPWFPDGRWGIFGSWGDFKLAWQGFNDLDHSQLLLSRQFHLIPYIF